MLGSVILSGSVSSIPRPFFLPCGKGRLFCVYHEPMGAAECWGNVLVVPAFNEEMNRCRSMVTIQAQALAKAGVGTLVVDLFGTGESDGEYGEARWDIWIDNIRQCVEWLEATQAGGCSALLGIRLGVPLALEAIRNLPHVKAVVAWQAVTDGKHYLTQFMRMRIAANMDRTDIPKETTGGMRGQLAAGQSIEVAGYEIAPELAHSIDGLRLIDLMPPESVSMAWFEKGTGEEPVISPVSQNLVEGWRQAGRHVDAAAYDAPAFWALYDRYISPELVEKTTEWVQSLRRQA
ncbi:MAG: hydrolase 2, exosortase A system-associated [Betaproteobacteria bacterium HGW-Betaproteobacteria-4]|nr:MAG: hydrolase 2, exosortase A system-associated [Betaproteobacteria bacterium HGW-Betaproteobacteria-4]